MKNLPIYSLLLLTLACQQIVANPRAKRQTIIFAPATPKPVLRPCVTPNQERGQCVNLRECEPLFNRLLNRPDAAFFNLLRKSICYYQASMPVICCPDSSATILTQHSTPPATQGPFVLSTSPRVAIPATTQPPPTTTTTAATTTTAPPTTPPPPTTTTTTTTTPTPPTPPPITTTTTTLAPLPPSTTAAPPPSTTTGSTITTSTTTAPSTPPGTTEAPTGAELLPRGICGHSTAQIPKIVGGRESNKGDWPWIAALGYEGGNGDVAFQCGGALITAHHVLTAAHCIYNQPSLKVVRMGEHHLTDETEAEHVDFSIKKKTMHPGFDSRTFGNDIALLTLDREVEFVKNRIMPICLPFEDEFTLESLVGFRPFVAGWGTVLYNGPSSSVLRDVQVAVQSEESCAESYSIFNTITIDNRTLCAGEGGVDACQGDSGGPLMQPLNEKFYLVGVVSFGIQVRRGGVPRGIHPGLHLHTLDPAKSRAIVILF